MRALVSTTSGKKYSLRPDTAILRTASSRSTGGGPTGSQQVWRKTRRLPNDVVPRGEQGARYEKKETVKGTETGTGTETRTRTGKITRARVGTRTGVGTGTRVEMRGEGRERLATFELVIGMGRKM